MGTGGTKFITFDNVAAGATAHGWWNNATAEMYRLSAWPKVAAGISASAEITQIRSIVHGNPSERELHFWVKNTGTTTIDIDVWGFWWDWALKPVLEDIRSEFNTPAVGGAIVTNQGLVALDVAGRRKHGDPTVVEPGDKWHLGSDTKAMTATLLGVLIQKGAAGGLSWNSTCAAAFPEWAQSMKSLKDCTFEQLMAHRSGITNVSSAEQTALGDTSKTIVQRRRNFAKLVVERQHGMPGGAYSYQNWNFILAAAMYEKSTGTSWDDMMKSELFQPLGMSTAGLGAPGSANNVDQPWGHSDATGQRLPNKGDNTPALGPAGTVHASLADWGEFLRLHLDGSAGALSLNSSTLTHLHTQFTPTPTSPERYGWGWIMWPDVGGLGLGHDGSNGSWYCSCQVLLGKGVAFLAVSNIGGGENGKGDEACWKIISTLRDQYFSSSGG